ncbi:MAG: cation:proton antiporter, partial [Actinobacteria bacterium]|nr:cation:proton antiporter [Actinomycetota bacterium]
MHETAILVIAGVLVGGVIAQWLGWRLRVPAIVFLLAGGLIAGPFTGALDPDDTFGELLFPAVSVAVAVILFEGALGLGWRGVKVAGRTVWMLLTVGAFTTLVLTMLAGRLLLDISWDLAVLLACVLVVTGPTVIGPIVRSIGLHGRLAAVLEAEGTLIDPIGAILTVLVFQAAFESGDGGSVVTDLLETLGVGAAIGVVAAAVLFIALRRFLIPDQLHNVTTLAVVIGAFALSSEIRAESGLVAVTVMGISLASQTRVSVRHVLEFNETLRIIFISGLFVLLGARIELDTLRELEWRNIAFLVALVLLVRPVSVFLSTLGSQLGRRERVFLALTAPRGIVAAAIASIFSLRLAEAGVKDSQQLVSATFTVIAGTVLLSGLGSKALGRRL